MKPALSVIFFTVLSGAGYGLWCWLGVAVAAGVYPATRVGVLVPLGFGFVLVTAGLLASTLHLGHPERAWRALTQWRSSWLSREGVASLVTYLPMLAVAALGWTDAAGVAPRAAGAALALGSLATLLCTANIYHSLKTIHAWRAPQVPPLYFMFALLSGGLWLWTWLALATRDSAGGGFPFVLLALAAVAAGTKIAWWRHLDEQPANTAGHATGLDSLGRVRAFEGPTTEASYITQEMAFVIARRHARRLRQASVVLFALLPIVGIAVALSAQAAWVALVAALLCIAGLFIERWLFFAEARHVVAAFFPSRGA